MSELFEIMCAPFVACLVLAGIHAYLGLHIIERRVIFVDLALAQIAALGATTGFIFGFKLHSVQCYFTALIFALIGAAVFALTRMRHEKVPQEALVGVVYAVSAAASVLLLSRAAEGGEELRNLLVGHLLIVSWPEIIKVAIIYSLVGIAHWCVRDRFLLISTNPEEAFRRGLNLRFWDFIFYATFALVVTSSVEMAGVLLVFSFLVVPSICAMLLAATIKARLMVGWLCGALTSMAGISASFYFDLPTGATVVCTFGVCLALCALLSGVKRIS